MAGTSTPTRSSRARTASSAQQSRSPRPPTFSSSSRYRSDSSSWTVFFTPVPSRKAPHKRPVGSQREQVVYRWRARWRRHRVASAGQRPRHAGAQDQGRTQQQGRLHNAAPICVAATWIAWAKASTRALSVAAFTQGPWPSASAPAHDQAHAGLERLGQHVALHRLLGSLREPPRRPLERGRPAAVRARREPERAIGGDLAGQHDRGLPVCAVEYGPGPRSVAGPTGDGLAFIRVTWATAVPGSLSSSGA
jgi:hypothetical protein